MKKHRFLFILLGLLLVAPQIFATAPIRPSFTDVFTTHPQQEAIYYLRNRGVISGYEDGSFKPERPVSRAEFLKMILRAAERNVPNSIAEKPFPDVAITSWYAPYIRVAVDVGIIDGYPDGKFYPDKTVSRIEAIKMLVKANYIAEKSLPAGASYADVPTNVWYTNYARFVYDNTLIDPFPGNKLQPDDALNRGQIAELIFRLYQKKPELAADTRDLPELNSVDSARILITPENMHDYSGRPNASACTQHLTTGNPNDEVVFSSKHAGINFTIPYSRLWGNASFRINPYDYENGNILFGPLQTSQNCHWERKFKLEFNPIRTPTDILTPLQSRTDILGLQRIKINSLDLITYAEQEGGCSRFKAIVIGGAYNYLFSTCGTWNDLQPILQTITLPEVTSFFPHTLL